MIKDTFLWREASSWSRGRSCLGFVADNAAVAGAPSVSAPLADHLKTELGFVSSKERMVERPRVRTSSDLTETPDKLTQQRERSVRFTIDSVELEC